MNECFLEQLYFGPVVGFTSLESAEQLEEAALWPQILHLSATAGVDYTMMLNVLY